MEEFKVKCILDGEWEGFATHNPKKGDILTVVWQEVKNNNLYYFFREIQVYDENGERDCYDANQFVRLTNSSFTNELTKLLSEKGIVKEGLEIIRTKELIPLEHERQNS